VNQIEAVFGRASGRVADPKNARDPATGRLIFEGGANFIDKYIRCGWIDVLHGGDGNWGEFASKRRATDWCRMDGEHYMEWVGGRGLQIDTFTNHSAVSSDFGIPDIASSAKRPRSLGDLPGSTAYWADYALRAGIKFYWSYIPTEVAAYRNTFGIDNLLVPAAFRDGQKFWHFSRYAAGGHYADTIDTIINNKNLDSLIANNHFEIVYTHLGYWSDNSKPVNPELSPSSIEALRLLKSYQDVGNILVTKTSRLLRYNLALNYLEFTAAELKQGTVIDLRAIRDSQFGDFIPTLRDVRGVTFYVSDSSKAEIWIDGVRVPEEELQRNPADETGRHSIGIAWFASDYTDYTDWSVDEVKTYFSS
jgi:hypothetical protein